MIWAILLLLLVLCGLAGVWLVLRWWERGTVQSLWQEYARNGVLDEFGDSAELQRLFFLADSLNPIAFIANYVEVSPDGFMGQLAPETRSPTPSTKAFLHGHNAPLGYPRWFLAAYPDVVLWTANLSDKVILNVMAEVIYGQKWAERLLQERGESGVADLLEHRRDLTLAQLRRLVDIYLRETGRRLECAI